MLFGIARALLLALRMSQWHATFISFAYCSGQNQRVSDTRFGSQQIIVEKTRVEFRRCPPCFCDGCEPSVDALMTCCLACVVSELHAVWHCACLARVRWCLANMLLGMRSAYCWHSSTVSTWQKLHSTTMIIWCSRGLGKLFAIIDALLWLPFVYSKSILAPRRRRALVGSFTWGAGAIKKYVTGAPVSRDLSLCHHRGRGSHASTNAAREGLET